MEALGAEVEVGALEAVVPQLGAQLATVGAAAVEVGLSGRWQAMRAGWVHGAWWCVASE